MLFTGGYWYLAHTGLLESFMNGAALQEHFKNSGIAGPLSVIGLMAGAIVVSPVPSAPIALASGAVFGHIWGTVYVLIGAELGAVIAFFIARVLGYEVLRTWFGKERLQLGLMGSQNTLMAIVFITRLLPFISFDLVSYCAGLTPLRAWRFVLATLAGIIPASFLLTHVGSEMLSGSPLRILLAAVLLGGLTMIPLLFGIYRTQQAKLHQQQHGNV